MTKIKWGISTKAPRRRISSVSAAAEEPTGLQPTHSKTVLILQPTTGRHVCLTTQSNEETGVGMSLQFPFCSFFRLTKILRLLLCCLLSSSKWKESRGYAQLSDANNKPTSCTCPKNTSPTIPLCVIVLVGGSICAECTSYSRSAAPPPSLPPSPVAGVVNPTGTIVKSKRERMGGMEAAPLPLAQVQVPAWSVTASE